MLFIASIAKRRLQTPNRSGLALIGGEGGRSVEAQRGCTIPLGRDRNAAFGESLRRWPGDELVAFETKGSLVAVEKRRT